MLSGSWFFIFFSARAMRSLFGSVLRGMDSVGGWSVVIYMCVSLSEARSNAGAFVVLVLHLLVNAMRSCVVVSLGGWTVLGGSSIVVLSH